MANRHLNQGNRRETSTSGSYLEVLGSNLVRTHMEEINLRALPHVLFYFKARCFKGSN